MSQGKPLIHGASLYLIICWSICESFICGSFLFIFLFSQFFSKQILEVCFINYIDCWISYMINKYGLYNVNGENNEPIQKF